MNNHREIARRWAKAHYNVETHRAWVQKNVKKAMLLHVKHNANGMPCTITTDDFDIPTVCPVLGIPLSEKCVSRKKAIKLDSTPTLDRRDNTLGYVKGNVFVISHRANRIKSDASAEELRRLWLYARGDLS